MVSPQELKWPVTTGRVISAGDTSLYGKMLSQDKPVSCPGRPVTSDVRGNTSEELWLKELEILPVESH